MNWYKHNIGDYLKKTVHLTMAQDGAYRRMMDEYYTNEKPLPLDRNMLYAKLRANTEEERWAVDSVLPQFFKQTVKGWVNKRAEEELINYRDRAKASRNNGLNGGRPKTNQDASRFQEIAADRNLEKPIPRRQKTEDRTKNTEEEKPSAPSAPGIVPEELWLAFVEHRRKLRSPLTDRASELIRQKLAKFKEQGYDPVEVLEQSISNGWKGVFPISEDRAHGTTKIHEQSRRSAEALERVFGTAKKVAGPVLPALPPGTN